MSAVHLPDISRKIRRQILEMIFSAGDGHLAGSFSSADLLTALFYGGIMGKNDRFVLSCGHCCPVLYSILIDQGKISEEELKNYKEIGSPLQGHPHKFPELGIETSSGPLGQGLSQAAGMALGLKMDHQSGRIFCLMSDGEQQKGQVWEAAMFASKYKLNNLVAMIDKNDIQIDGEVGEIMDLGDLSAKYLSFGWRVFELNGHNFVQILDTLEKAKKEREKPALIIAKTVAGKGISFMEGRWEWHHGKLSEEQYKMAMAELI